MMKFFNDFVKIKSVFQTKFENKHIFGAFLICLIQYAIAELFCASVSK